MRFVLMACALVFGFNVSQSTAGAAELRSNQRQVEAARALPKTVVVRVNNRTQKVEVLHSMAKLSAKSRAKVVRSHFTPANVHGKMRSGHNLWGFDWIFSFGNDSWYYPTYNYYGTDYTYSNYYTYPYGDYTYYYFGNPYYDWSDYGYSNDSYSNYGYSNDGYSNYGYSGYSY